eukprot:PRCOL_00000871-RA
MLEARLSAHVGTGAGAGLGAGEGGERGGVGGWEGRWALGAAAAAAVGAGLAAWASGHAPLAFDALRARGAVLRADAGAAPCDAHPASAAPGYASRREDLPEYTAADVSTHSEPKSGVWVSYGQGVYDITEFAKGHPGGSEKIMLAAGGALEPFWALFAEPHGKLATLQLLETLRIGNLRQDAAAAAAIADIDDPYAEDPPRHPALVVQSPKPFNAESPAATLADARITPIPLFFIRHHMPVPLVDEKDYVLSVGDTRAGASSGTLELSLDDLKKFPKVEVEATMQCTGNRRSSANEVKPTKGINWGVGAISNAVWGGARLRDVLEAAGIDVEALATGEGEAHVRFEGMDLDPSGDPYGSSVPARRALRDGSAVLAYEMNGEPMPRDHGAPVRVIVPGVTGARSVKWVASLEVADEESESFWQRQDYKIYPPNTSFDNLAQGAKHAIPIQDTPLQSAITSPVPGATVSPRDGEVACAGYAFAGGGRGILRVDVSFDGENWTQAELDRPQKSAGRTYAWTLWKASVPIPESAQRAAGGEATPLRLRVRALDDEHNTQPSTAADVWNMRGLLTNSWHSIDLVLPGKGG